MWRDIDLLNTEKINGLEDTMNQVGYQISSIYGIPFIPTYERITNA